MKIQIRRIQTLVLMIAACVHLQAQPKVHPFEQPPFLRNVTPANARPATFAFRAAPTQTCDPQGSVSRDGNVVKVTLDVVRADFTINNPDPADPYKGEDPVTLRSYGGCKSGPVIEVVPGNTLQVDLVNKLDANDPSCLSNPPVGLGLPPGDCFNTINLHTHGLHVSPAGNSDNVLLNIAPQTEFPYEINIPLDHPAGTFWYHAHRHGSTAVQVASGASGFLIITGDRPYTPPTPQNPHPIADIDTILHDARGTPFPEQLFLLQQIPYACFKNDPNLAGGPWQQIYTTKGLFDANTDQTNLDTPAYAPWTCPTPAPGNYVSRGALENFGLQLFSSTIWDTSGRFTSVNGIVEPTMTLPAGEIQRWRFLHAGVHDTVNLQIVRVTPVAGAADLIATSALSGNRLEQQRDVARFCPVTPQTLIPQFEIAEDGLTRTKMRMLGGPSGPGAVGSNFMQPGYRSDVLVVFPEDGDYCLLDQAAPAAERVHAGPKKGQILGGGQGPSVAQLLAYVHVRGGRAVTGDLQAYLEQALYNSNPNLPPAVRTGLMSGDLTAWAPFTELAPAPAVNVQNAVFAISNTGQFQINGKSYDPGVVNIVRQVNTTDEWLLSIDNNANAEPHIFHIHVNPFEVIDVTTAGPYGNQVSIFDSNGNCTDKVLNDPQGLANQYCGMYHVFRDTIFVENNYTVHVRTHYDRYIGEFVIHCHILDHEDAGMMLNIQIVPDLNAPGGGLGMPQMNHAH
jgi:FtsP/CotA-like multicopper oxidase with cupredoxin domain